MPDLLVLSIDANESMILSNLGKEEGFRVKVTLDPSIAREWLELKSFDAVLIPSSIPLANQEELSELTWRSKAQSPVVLYSLHAADAPPSVAERVYGTEVAYGPSAIDLIRKALQEVRYRKVTESGLGVLVVEDLDSPRDIICAYLEEKGIRVVKGANSGADALRTLRENTDHFGCIVSDLRMPEMSGKELVEAIRRDTSLSHLPVIMLTAYGSVDSLIDCLKAGASGFLLKPPKIKDLHREVERAFRLVRRKGDPRLTSAKEAERVRYRLLEKGFV
jgi:two-component system, chemotaxis family, chemotaxis protein CheY